MSIELVDVVFGQLKQGVVMKLKGFSVWRFAGDDGEDVFQQDEFVGGSLDEGGFVLFESDFVGCFDFVFGGELDIQGSVDFFELFVEGCKVGGEQMVFHFSRVGDFEELEERFLVVVCDIDICHALFDEFEDLNFFFWEWFFDALPFGLGEFGLMKIHDWCLVCPPLVEKKRLQYIGYTCLSCFFNYIYKKGYKEKVI